MINYQNLIKNLIKFGLVILTIISLSLAVKSNYFLDMENIHKENFVMISLTKYFKETCEEGEAESESESYFWDSGDSGLEPCYPGRYKLYDSTASGLIIKKIEDISYILTANHFCNSESIEERLYNILDDSFENVIISSDFDSKKYLSQIIFTDEYYDLCLLSSKIERRVDIIRFSDMPEIGEKIYTIASPLGISESGILLHFEGFFSGCENTGMCFYTIPATSGSSGSVVFDSRGRAIGIIQMTPIYFRSMSIGVGSREIISFLQNASKSLGVDLI
jgi:S1-C subfamily serine protease